MPRGQAIPIRGSETGKSLRAKRMRPFFSARTMDGGSVPSRHRKNAPSNGLEEVLISALLAGDSELGQIVQEVEEISRVLKSGSPDSDSLRVATHPSVWGAVKHALLARELRYLALTDDLTCLYNRRAFFAAAAQQLKVARRNSKNILLLFCDVDDLKSINDTYGHREGDMALVRTADAIEEAFRDSDILARIGGDEFAVLATLDGNECGEILVERLNQSLNKSNAKEPRYTLSVSIGAARFNPRKPLSLGELMAEADKAMYEQKPSKLPRRAAGREQVNPVTGPANRG